MALIDRLYYRRILPEIIDFAMGLGRLMALRRRHLSVATGRVLEVGIGSGRNLASYGPDMTALIGIDTSAELLRMAHARRPSAGVNVTLIHAAAEAIPLAASSVDTVAVTWSLCSVGDVSRVLQEVRRVLKPSGVLLFVEHGLAPDPRIARWQRRLTPLWRHVAGGCHLDRPVDMELQRAGFTLVTLETMYLPGPRVLTYMYAGRCTRD